VQRAAETAFAACGCRDYARVDFMLSPEHDPYLLEINTLPGMKETSLLPMSARCTGLDFTGLVRELVQPALQRFQAAASAARS
jgi:D-alanine-D-alanine ligase